MKPIAVLLLLVAVALAGCADNAPAEPGESTDPDDGELDSGKGAISGLVIDDRFRPIVAASVLVQEAGIAATSNANGEFTVVNLAPGTYTLRVTAEGHEAAPVKVTVDEGAYADANLVARRVASADGGIVTREYAIFIPCNAYATFGCPPDNSGDTYRPGIRDSFEDYLPELTYSAWEIRLNNPYIFCLEVREEGTGGAATARHFANWCEGQDSTYLKGILQVNETYTPEVSADPWDPTAQTDAILFTFGNNEATCWEKPPENNRYRCAGTGFAIKAQIVVTFFLGEPEVDLEEYCVLC